ncbi:MAG: solute carrier family 23 protein, partial [Chloroflexota bacterium]
MIYQSYERPPLLKLSIYSLQVVAMSTYAIVWGLAFIGLNINLSREQLAIFVTITIFSIGLSTLLQASVGHRIGLISGPNIVPAFTMLTAIESGLPFDELFGGFIVGGIVVTVLGWLGFVHYLQRFFTPLVMGTLVMMVGLGTATIGVNFLALLGPTFFVISIALALAVGYISYALSGFVSTIGVLLVVLLGYLIATVTGHLDWEFVGSFPLFTPPQGTIFGVAWPRLSILLPAILAMVISSMQAMAYILSSADVAEETVSEARIRPIMSVFGILETALPSFFSATPTVTYSTNTGFLAATRVSSRYPAILAGIILMIIGSLGPVSGFLAAIPEPVAGAILLGVAGPTIGIGAKLWRTGTPTFTNLHAFIVGFSLFL